MSYRKKWMIAVIIILFIFSVNSPKIRSTPQGSMMGPEAGMINQGMLAAVPGASMALPLDPVVSPVSATPSISMGITAVTHSPPLMVSPLMGNQGILLGMGASPMASLGVSPVLNMGVLPGAMLPLPGAMLPLQGSMISIPEPMAFMPGPFMGMLNPMMGMSGLVPGMFFPMMSLSPMMGFNPMINMNPAMNMNPMVGVPYPIMGMNPMMIMNPMMNMRPMMNMAPNMGMDPMMNMPETIIGPPPIFPIFQLPLLTIPSTVATSPVRTANVPVVPAGDSCIFCHEDLTRMTELGYPEFYFLLDTVQAETGMPGTCVDCHLGNPASFTVAGAHTCVLGLMVMKNQYRDIVRRKDVIGPEYELVRSIASVRASNTNDPRYRLRVQTPFHMLLWHDRNLSTASWNPDLSMQTCKRCHPAQVAEFATTEMGLVQTMSQYIPWIAPPTGLATHLNVAPQSCSLWKVATIPPNNDSFTDENRLLYNSTSTRIAN